jgi:hypothetical protein
LVISLAKGKEPLGGPVRLDPKAFEVEELYAAMERDIDALRMTELLIENRLLVDGRSIHDDQRFISGRPDLSSTSIDADELRELVRTPELCNRVYQSVRLLDWDGDLILSVFINFTRKGSCLLAEVRHFLLAPIMDNFREVDLLASRSRAQNLTYELRAAWRIITALLTAPFIFIGTVFGIVPHRKSRQSGNHGIDADSGDNYGAMTSIRELAQSARYRRYFQQVDYTWSQKLLDQQVLDTVMAFLDAHDIDISQFEEQRTTILNQGILISGGQFNAGSVAVGESSQARMTQFTQGIRDRVGQAERRQGDTT